MKILVVDDQKTHTKLIKSILKKEKDIDFISALNVFDAYAILKVIPDIGALILDNKMPHVEGTTFCNFLRETELFKSLPIIFSSATEIDNSKMPNTFLLKKPYSMDDLLNAVQQISTL